MNRVLFMFIISIGSLLPGMIILRLIFKNSVMYSVCFWALILVLICSFTNGVVGHLGSIHALWSMPLDFACGIIIFVRIKAKLTVKLNTAIEDVKELAQGNLDIDTHDVEVKSELGILQNSINDLTRNLRKIVGEITTTASNLSMNSVQLGSMSEEMSSGASEQASSIEELSSTLEEISATLKDNKDKAQYAGEISKNSAEVVANVALGSTRMIETYKHILDKISIVNSIAFQTNILALNAAVEAARVGEQGRGFAVVADEVKRLADSSKGVATEIIQISSKTVELTQNVEHELAEMLPKITESAAEVQNIVRSSIEQAHGIEQINISIQQLNHVTQQNASSSEEIAANAEELSAQAESLTDLISFFKLEKNPVEKAVYQYRTKTDTSTTKFAKIQESKINSSNQKEKIRIKLDGNDQLDEDFTKFQNKN